MRSVLLSLFAILAFSACSYGATTPEGSLPDFTQIAAKATPSIVTVYVTIPAKEPQIFFMPKGKKSPKIPKDLPPDFPPDFFDLPPDIKPPKESKKKEPEFEHASGSGFIISQDGLIITNNHVVENQVKIVVLMSDSREYIGHLVAADPLSDVAVIKIQGTNFPTVKIGHSSEVKQGQWVAVMGSPFGFDGTLTVGIVSAIDRYLDESAYTPFIQTDAAINHGNSGGPLFNLSGEVIGINSQIYSRTGDFNGVGFSIPIDIAMNVEKQLVQFGHVTRGKMGVTIVNVDQEKADKFGLSRPKGGAVVDFDKTGPAAAAGIKIDDVVLAVNDLPVEKSSQIPVIISSLKPGTIASLTVWRDKKLIVLNIKIAEMKDLPKVDSESEK